MSATLTPTPVVTTTQKPQTVGVTRPVTKGNIIVRWLTSTDHKIIGHMYNITSILYFLLGGVMALIAVLTVSDRASAGVYEDKGGPAIEAWLRRAIDTSARLKSAAALSGMPSIRALAWRLKNGTLAAP